MSKLKIQATTENGLLAALTVIMGLMAVYLPILGTVATLLWPLPVIVAVVRHGLRSGLLSVAVAAIIMSALISPLNAFHLVATFAPTGLVLGYGFGKGWPASRILMAGLIASILGVILASLALFLISGLNPFDLEQQLDSMRSSLDSSIALYTSLGMSQEEINALKESMGLALEMTALLMPLGILAAGLLTAWLNFAVGGKLLRHLGQEVALLPAFDQWRLPQIFFYLFLMALIGLYWGTTRDWQPLYQISMNVVFMSIFAGFIQGVSILSCLLRPKLSRLVFWLLIIFIFLNNLFAQILAFIGLFDMIIDYRRRFFKGQA